jgi:hypothetical protein
VAAPSSISPAEQEAINAVIPYDQITSRYGPFQADAIKNSWRTQTATTADLATYLGTWLKMGFQHPALYTAAAIMECHSYFSPASDKGWVWLNMACYGTSDQTSILASYQVSGFTLHQLPALQGARDTLRGIYQFYQATPLDYLTNMGAMSWLLLFCAVLLLRRRKLGSVGIRSLLPLLPMLTLLLIFVASPDNGNIRYALPLIFTMPLIATYTCYQLRA